MAVMCAASRANWATRSWGLSEPRLMLRMTWWPAAATAGDALCNAAGTIRTGGKSRFEDTLFCEEGYGGNRCSLRT
jgi:hypothetical protein